MYVYVLSMSSQEKTRVSGDRGGGIWVYGPFLYPRTQIEKSLLQFHPA